jgi:hypothetical protein
LLLELGGRHHKTAVDLHDFWVMNSLLLQWYQAENKWAVFMAVRAVLAKHTLMCRRYLFRIQIGFSARQR